MRCFDAVLQGQAVQKLHGDERLLAVFADFIDGADVRVVESGRGVSLAAKAFESLRVLRKILGQEFEGDEAAEFSVLGLVNHAHAAPAEFFHDAVVRDGLSDHVDAVSIQAACPRVWADILGRAQGSRQRAAFTPPGF